MKGKARSLEIRKYLVSVYVTQGYEVAKPLAIKYGYRPRYLNHLAKDILGHHRKIFYSRNPFVEDRAYRFDPRFETPIDITKERMRHERAGTQFERTIESNLRAHQ